MNHKQLSLNFLMLACIGGMLHANELIAPMPLESANKQQEILANQPQEARFSAPGHQSQNIDADELEIPQHQDSQNRLQTKLHDPTQPPELSFGQAANSTYKLESIRIDSTKALALINGHWFAVGDRIGSARILAIHKNHVVLFSQDHKMTLSLFGRRLWIEK